MTIIKCDIIVMHTMKDEIERERERERERESKREREYLHCVTA